MNLYKLSTALLVGAVISAASHNNNNNGGGARQVSLEGDDNNLFRILLAVRDGDRPEALCLEGCSVTYTDGCMAILNFMTTRGRPRSLGFFLGRLRFAEPAERDRVLTHVLHCALHENSLEMVRVVLGQEFDIQRDASVLWWSPEGSSWDLEAWKEIVSEQPERAAGLAPRTADMGALNRPADALVLIELARHCDDVSGQARFDPTAILCHFLFHTRFGDADTAAVVGRLLELGAERNEHVWGLLARCHPDYVQTLERLLEF
jgi:hypothetical protein